MVFWVFMKRSVAIGIGILVLVALGFLLTNGMSGNAILGSTIHNANYENEYFKIGDVGNSELNDEVIDNDTQNIGESE